MKKNNKVIAFIILVIMIIIVVLVGIVKLQPNFRDETIVALTNNDIGKYVKYTPETGNYIVTTTYGAHKNNQTFTTDESLKWRIWSISNDTLTLISDKASSVGGYEEGRLWLKGALGYNNGVTHLNSICEKCYSNSSIGAVGRSINLDDVLSVKAETITCEYSEYGTTPYTYENAIIPYVWYNKERMSTETSIKSKDYGLTTKTTVSDNITPYFNLWHTYDMNKSTSWSREEYCDMVMIDQMYWLASRYAWPYLDEYCDFGLQVVGTRDISGGTLLGGNPSGQASASLVRPIVEIPLDTIKVIQAESEICDYVIKAK